MKHFLPLKDNYDNHYSDLRIGDVIDNPVPSRILAAGEFGAPREYGPDAASEPLGVILKSGILKVGFDIYDIPFCYFNRWNEISGYDVAYIYELARDLDCQIEFVPLNLEKMGSELQSGLYDMGIGALVMDEHRLKLMDFTSAYTEQNNVMIVAAKDRRKFLDLLPGSGSGLKIGAVGAYKSIVTRHFPEAILVPDADINDALENGKVDAWMWGRRSALVWCENHPNFIVAEYQGLIGKRFYAYPLRTGSIDWNLFLNNWMILKQKSGFKKDMERYWIEGRSIKEREPRWSILQNLLKWNS